MLERILMLMQEKGINAVTLTNDLDLAGSSVTDWKRGKSKPGTETIVKLADYFGVTTDYLLGKSNIPTPPTADTVALLERIAHLEAENAAKDKKLNDVLAALT